MSNNKHTVVGNLVRWVKDTPMQDALVRNQFDLVMALCVEDNTYPSFSPVFGQYVKDSINVSDIVDFILWGSWVENRETTSNLLKEACALLENYKDTAVRLWPSATAGDLAYRAIMFMMNYRGKDIIGDRLNYSLAMSAILNISSELLGPVKDTTASMFSNTPLNVFHIFATEVYMPHALPRPNLYCQDVMLDIIEDENATVSTKVASLHTKVWGSNAYVNPCSDTLKLITTVSQAMSQSMSDTTLQHLYVAGMAISGLLASHQMLSNAMPDANVLKGWQYIKEVLQIWCRKKRSNDEGTNLLSTSAQRQHVGTPLKESIQSNCRPQFIHLDQHDQQRSSKKQKKQKSRSRSQNRNRSVAQLQQSDDDV